MKQAGNKELMTNEQNTQAGMLLDSSDIFQRNADKTFFGLGGLYSSTFK